MTGFFQWLFSSLTAVVLDDLHSFGNRLSIDISFGCIDQQINFFSENQNLTNTWKERQRQTDMKNIFVLERGILVFLIVIEDVLH